MYLIHTVSIQPDRDYLCMTDAQWLTMPLQRQKDSIGSCIYDFLPIPNTSSGYFQYTENSVDSLGKLTKTTKKGSVSNIQSRTNGLWNGVGGFIQLPSDVASSSGPVKYHTNLYAHFQYMAEVHFFEQGQNVQSVGTYEHAHVTVVPSLSITVFSSTNASIGISFAYSKDTFSAHVRFAYNP